MIKSVQIPNTAERVNDPRIVEHPITVQPTGDLREDLKTSMNGGEQDWMTFRVGPYSLALPLRNVRRGHRSAEVTPLMNAPADVMGILDVAGEVFPVFDLRRRFDLPQQEIQLSDHFLIVEAATRNVVIVSEEVIGVRRFNDEDSMAAQGIDSRFEQIHGVLKTSAGIYFVYDLDRFLSPSEVRDLNRAMAPDPATGGVLP